MIIFNALSTEYLSLRPGQVISVILEFRKRTLQWGKKGGIIILFDGVFQLS